MRANGERTFSGSEKVGPADIGLSPKQIHEARQIRDAELVGALPVDTSRLFRSATRSTVFLYPQRNRSEYMGQSTPEAGKLRQAFARAHHELMADGAERIRPEDIIFQALTEAMGTLHKLPDREAGWLYCSRSGWPDVAEEDDDRLVAYYTTLERIRLGQESADIFIISEKATPASVTRMEVLFEVLPKYLVGARKADDWKILCRLAAGQTGAKIAKALRCSRQTVCYRRNLQLSALAKALVHYIPADDRPGPNGKNQLETPFRTGQSAINAVL